MAVSGRDRQLAVTLRDGALNHCHIREARKAHGLFEVPENIGVRLNGDYPTAVANQSGKDDCLLTNSCSNIDHHVAWSKMVVPKPIVAHPLVQRLIASSV